MRTGTASRAAPWLLCLALALSLLPLAALLEGKAAAEGESRMAAPGLYALEQAQRNPLAPLSTRKALAPTLAALFFLTLVTSAAPALQPRPRPLKRPRPVRYGKLQLEGG